MVIFFWAWQWLIELKCYRAAAAAYQKPVRLLMLFLEQKVAFPNIVSEVCKLFKISSSL